MRAVVKRFHSPDVDDLAKFQPDEPEKFGFLLQVMVGPKDQTGEESFDIEICTPKWLMERYRKEDVIPGRHRLIIFEYNYQRLVQFIRDYCERWEGKSWEELAEKISRLGHWEFEDYKEPQR